MTTMTGEEHASRKGDFQARDFMTSTIVHEFIQMIEDETQSRPTPVEFEMAYQARVAIDRIRFAIKQTEQFGPQTDRMRGAGLQLLDALERLELVDRRFQNGLGTAPRHLSGTESPLMLTEAGPLVDQ